MTTSNPSCLIKGIHHINLLVKDLAVAVARYQQVLGVDEMIFAELEHRGMRCARFSVGGTWIVLVQPTDPEGVPGRHLAEHGEGLFLMSFEVDSLEDAALITEQKSGRFLSDEPRQGLEDWRVLDLDPDQFFGARLQLISEG